jgi:putative ABC transport system permease protein
MMRISLRDLQWRRRRFVIVVFVAALAFGLALLMTGVSNQLSLEGRNTVALFGADQWVVADGVSGPFTTSQLIDGEVAGAVAHRPGVQVASPILIGRTTVGQLDVNIVGYDPHSPMLPAKLSEARAAAADPDGAIADVSLARSVGSAVPIGGREVPVVALVQDTAFYFSAPTVFLPLPVVQDLLFSGQDVASAVVVRGDVGSAALPSLDVLTNAGVQADFDRVIKSSTETISIISVLLWSMAAGIVAAIVYVSVLERTRDLATLKAMGTSTVALLRGLVAQAVLVSVVSAAASVAVCRALAPAFSFPVSVPAGAYVQLLAIASIVGFIASLAGMRRITQIDPALAFGGAS